MAPRGNEPLEPKRGRPSEYTEAIADIICGRLALGESLRAICADADVPHIATVMRWIDKNAEFRERYARARELQAEYLIDEIIEIADTPKVGIKTVSKVTGIETTEADMIEHRRLQVDARKWAAAKLYPKKYGEKTETTLKGDPNSPVQTVSRNMTAKEAAEAYAGTLDSDKG